MRPIPTGFAMVSLATLASGLGGTDAAGQPPVATVIPPAKEIHRTAEGRWVGHSRITVLVEPDAHPTVRLAAEALQISLARRFGLNTRILVGDADVPKGEGGMFFALGEAGEGRMVNRLCERRDFELSLDGVGPDGYAIHMYSDRYDRVIVVAGTNARAVFYGQDTLCQLIRPRGPRGQVSVPATDVRDWPSIPWRGHPAPRYTWYLGIADERADPGDGLLDGCLRARLNFIDLRHDSMGLRWERLTEEDYAAMKRLIEEAHRRSLLVYATFVVPADPADLPQMSAAVERVLDLGPDGLWLSCDDTVRDPNAGEQLIDAIKSLLAIAAERGIAGHRIAYTPPLRSKLGSYSRLSPEHKMLLDAVPAIREALYFITQPPSAEQHRAGVEAGLDQYAWWHNWPRGWRYRNSLPPVADSLQYLIDPAGGSKKWRGLGFGYNGFVSLTEGWGRPDPGAMRDAGDYINAAIFWGLSEQAEYVQCTMGHWAWDPAHYDEDESRMAIYRAIFGRQGAEPAKAFDDALMRVKMAFLVQPEPGEARARRGDEEIRNDPVVRAGLEEMKTALSGVEWVALDQTLLPADRLEKMYLARMRAEVSALEEFLNEKAPS